MLGERIPSPKLTPYPARDKEQNPARLRLGHMGSFLVQ